jgi:hypothetical protein
VACALGIWGYGSATDTAPVTAVTARSYPAPERCMESSGTRVGTRLARHMLRTWRGPGSPNCPVGDRTPGPRWRAGTSPAHCSPRTQGTPGYRARVHRSGGSGPRFGREPSATATLVRQRHLLAFRTTQRTHRTTQRGTGSTASIGRIGIRRCAHQSSQLLGAGLGAPKILAGRFFSLFAL